MSTLEKPHFFGPRNIGWGVSNGHLQSMFGAKIKKKGNIINNIQYEAT